MNRRVARISQRVGGAFLRGGNNSKRTGPKFSSVLNQTETVFLSKSGDLKKKRRSSPKLKRFFRPELSDLKKKKSSPKLKRFFRPELGDLKKKKVFTKIQSLFLTNFGCAPEKKLHFSSPNNSKSFATSAPQSRWGLFSFLEQKSATKALKRTILHTFQANGGARAPLATLLIMEDQKLGPGLAVNQDFVKERGL